jgi:hydroxycarboxylate dehydrogenase B
VNVVGHPPLVAPFRGRDCRLATNPFSVGVPGEGGAAAVLLDLATSEVAFGKVRDAMARGERAPAGALVDAEGRPTDDPAVLFATARGALRPFGAHKGSGLALACELLAGALGGGGTVSRVPYEEGRIGNNMLSILIDPARLPGGAGLAGEVAATVAWVKASPPADPALPVLVAGEPEAASRAARLAGGIAIDDAIWDELRAAAASVGATIDG